MSIAPTNSALTQTAQDITMLIAIALNAARTLGFARSSNTSSQNHGQGVDKMKLIKTLTAIILAEIAIAIPILVSIYVWSMVFFV
jgi:hypothetical protein